MTTDKLEPPQALKKYSVMIAGHSTSIRIEPPFWQALNAAAVARQLPLNALVANIDVWRLESGDPPNLASAIRQWLYAQRS